MTMATCIPLNRSQMVMSMVSNIAVRAASEAIGIGIWLIQAAVTVGVALIFIAGVLTAAMLVILAFRGLVWAIKGCWECF